MSSDTSSPDVVFYFMSGSTCLSRLKQLPTDLQSRRMASGIKHLFWFIGSFMTIWAFVRQRVIFACILVQNQKIVFFFQCVKYAAEIYRFSFDLSYLGHFLCACFICHYHFVLQRSDLKKNNDKDFILHLSNCYDPKIWYFLSTQTRPYSIEEIIISNAHVKLFQNNQADHTFFLLGEIKTSMFIQLKIFFIEYGKRCISYSLVLF